MKTPGLILLGLLCAGPAAAAPVFLPTRDVSINYELSTPGQPTQNYTLDYNAASERARVENPAQGGIYFLLNLPQGQAQVIVPALHAIVEAPDFSSLTHMIFTADNANFTPLGRGHYAGMACQKYLVLNTQGSGTACITADGVVLHFSGHDAHGSADITANSVTFTSEPPNNFAAPSAFSNITLPPGALAALLQSN
ncbi:MAG: hypothetical protein B7X08_01735 [Acidocella sp. 20-63-7]|nr:MAG: hypothetical protein B7X08_01735 [Acidocella sp. 20-63-7]HQT46136.1 hypothetical protein [Acidocella sp.]